MAIQMKNLGAALGAEVADIDLSKPLPHADIDAIEATWRERLVVVFHGQNLSDPQLIAFSKNFGELDPPGPNPYGEPFNKDHPELNVISNVLEAVGASAVSTLACSFSAVHPAIATINSRATVSLFIVCPPQGCVLISVSFQLSRTSI